MSSSPKLAHTRLNHAVPHVLTMAQYGQVKIGRFRQSVGLHEILVLKNHAPPV